MISKKVNILVGAIESDTETGLYYLRSRYYNPAWGRFINADSMVGTTGALLSHNIYSYCLNNPTILADPSGCIPIVVGVAVWKLGELLIGGFLFLGSVVAEGMAGDAIISMLPAPVPGSIPDRAYPGPAPTIMPIPGATPAPPTSIATPISVSISKADAESDSQSRRRRPPSGQYWLAGIVNGNVVPGVPLNFSQARNAALSGNNILAVNSIAAGALAKSIGIYKGPEKDKRTPKGKTYLYHYHITRGWPVHIWFYGNP